MVCERCGAQMPEGVTVCSQCGHSQADVPDPADNVSSFVPQELVDDPITGDGSASRPGVDIAPWRLKTLGEDRLGSISEPDGEGWSQRRVRRDHERSREARGEDVRIRRGRRRTMVALWVAIIVVCLAAVGLSYAYELWGGKTIPNVMGVSQGNALALLEDKGFAVDVASEPSDAMVGHVIGVEPAEGTRVDAGSTVHLTVAEARHMPDVVGLDEDSARDALEKAGAKNVRFVSRIAFEPDGTVVETRPEADAVFMSTDEVVVALSQLPRMPDVVGDEEAVALATLELAEIPAEVAYERAGVEERLRVLHTTPAADEAVEDEGAQIFVGDPLVSAVRLSDYFDGTAPHIRDFLTGEGFSAKVGHLTQDGHVVARFDDAAGSYVAFVSDPWSHAVAQDKTAFTDVLGDGARIEGVRMSVPIVRETKPATTDGAQEAQKEEPTGDSATNDAAVGEADTQRKEGGATKAENVTFHAESLLSLESPTVSEATALEVMRLCGFSDVRGACTQDSIIVPEGTNKAGHAFYCCFGEVRNCLWTVLVRGAAKDGKIEATEIVVTCAPRSAYATIDLAKHGGKVCDYVAYMDEYVR